MIQNLVLSGIIIAAIIAVAATGLLGLGAVAAIHEIAEIVVIVNALRASRAITAHSTHEHAASGLPRPNWPSMPDQSRWRTPPHINDFSNNELSDARNADDPWTHLERSPS